MTTRKFRDFSAAPRRLSEIPHAYLALCREIRRHMKRRGWAAWQMEDAAGWQDNYAGKALNPASPSGRVAGYHSLDLALTALVGRGYRILVVPEDFSTDLRRGDCREAVAALLDEQDATEAERVAQIIDFAANTNRRPKYDV